MSEKFVTPAFEIVPKDQCDFDELMRVWKHWFEAADKAFKSIGVTQHGLMMYRAPSEVQSMGFPYSTADLSWELSREIDAGWMYLMTLPRLKELLHCGCVILLQGFARQNEMSEEFLALFDLYLMTEM